MSKKFFIILISIVLGLLLVSLVGYYFIIQNNGGASSEGPFSGFRSFFPFGGNDNNDTGEIPVEPNTNEPEVPEPVNFTQKLRQLSAEHVSGAGVNDITAGTIARYIEKATGHIYEVELFSPKIVRISNTTIPVVYDAIWNSKNNSLVARYLNDDDQTIDTYSLILKNTSTTTENTLSGIPFPGNITDVSISGDSVFYLRTNDTSSMGYVSNLDGTKTKLMWNSSIKELLAQYVNTKTVALTTKPYQYLAGFMYFVDTGTGVVRSILSNIPGLSTLTSPDATKVIYLSQGGQVDLYLHTVSNKALSVLSPITFPEKCVWSKKNVNVVYCAVPKDTPDDTSLTNWYQGKISTSDSIWMYDLGANTSTIVVELEDSAGEQIDVIKPILSEKEQYLVFINKIDNSLWSLDLTK